MGFFEDKDVLFRTVIAEPSLLGRLAASMDRPPEEVLPMLTSIPSTTRQWSGC